MISDASLQLLKDWLNYSFEKRTFININLRKDLEMMQDCKTVVCPADKAETQSRTAFLRSNQKITQDDERERVRERELESKREREKPCQDTGH